MCAAGTGNPGPCKVTLALSCLYSLSGQALRVPEQEAPEQGPLQALGARLGDWSQEAEPIVVVALSNHVTSDTHGPHLCAGQRRRLG